MMFYGIHTYTIHTYTVHIVSHMLFTEFSYPTTQHSIYGHKLSLATQGVIIFFSMLVLSHQESRNSVYKGWAQYK